MKKLNLVMVVLLLTMLAVPSMADTNTSTPNFMPSLSVGWNGLPHVVQSIIIWAISIAFVILIAVAILSTFGGLGKIVIGKRGGKIGQSSSGFSDVFIGVGVIIAAIAAIAIIIYVVNAFT